MRGVKIILFVLALSCSMIFVGCDTLLDVILNVEGLFDDSYGDEDGSAEENDGDTSHTCVFGEWEVAEDSTCLEVGERERQCTICFETESEVIAKKSHRIVIDPEVAATDKTPGKTEGKHCSLCGTIILRQEFIYSGDYTTPSKYSSDYAYSYLLTNYENGEDMQEFYRSLDETAEYFHSSSTDAQSKIVQGITLYYAAEIDISQFNLTIEEAVAVWSAYRFDHPLYYWMSNQVTHTDKQLTVIVYDEYADGDVRDDYNSRLYDKVEDYVVALDGRGSEYQIALSFHDGIILSADYAYEDDGVTPEADAFAHNVLGVMLLGGGVCESYTKAFQLLLNYCGVENVYVSGYAGEPHAWNLVRLDNGEWYWFDLTWDDTPKSGLGVRYSYFCVNDADNVKIFDGAADDFATFMQDHFPDDPVDFGTEFAYSIPERASESFSYDGPMLRDDVIEIDGMSYVIFGSDTCALVNIAVDGDVVIPESISYMGFEYAVAVIGCFENGKIVSGSVIETNKTTYKTPDISSITIPKTVKVIWDYAFIHSKTVRSFTVDSENNVYASRDGVLFTKSLYTLIQYPLAKDAVAYSVPDLTVEIAYGAFGDGGNIFCPQTLKTLTVGNNVEVYGAGHFGRGYRDSRPTNASEIVTISGYLEKMKKIFGSGLLIEE